MKNKTLKIKAADSEKRIFECVMSCEICDRDGEVVLLDGLDTETFKSNPVMLFDHGFDNNRGKLPVGKVISVERKGEDLIGECEFLSRPETHPQEEEWLPDTLNSIVKQGCLNAVSMGFIIKEGRKPDASDLKKYGEECSFIITKSELCELSIVAIPANQAALITAVRKGFLPKSSKAYIKSEEIEKTPVIVGIKKKKHTIKVNYNEKERMKKMVMIRVKGGLYA